MYAYSLILNIVVSPDTSDVQMVCGVLTQEKATVLCSFSEGSLAIGCQVTLALELNNETVHNFTRDPSSRLAMGHLSVEISAVSDGGYMLYASDIEPDGTIGEIRIEGNFSTSCSHNDLPAGGEIIFFAHFMCTVTTLDTIISSDGAPFPLLAVTLSSIGAVLLVLIFTLTLIFAAQQRLACVRSQQGNFGGYLQCTCILWEEREDYMFIYTLPFGDIFICNNNL